MPRLDVAHQRDQARHVEDVLQALAHRLEDDREDAVFAGHREQLGGPLPLLPQRRAAAGVAARQQQRARRALAEPGGEQRRPADLRGSQVHAPWALVVAARLRERYGVDVQAMHSDDGIVLRLPDIEFEEGTTLHPASGPAPTWPWSAPDEVEPLVTAEVGGSALFASRFRECAARALLAAAAQPRPAHPAVAAAAAVRPAARRWPATTARSRSCSRRCASACRTSSTCRAWSA